MPSTRIPEARARRCDVRGVHYLDVGVSGGIWGWRRGYYLMIRWRPVAAKRLEPVFWRWHQHSSKPPGPSADSCSAGQSGSGHFVKMVHNGIEYGTQWPRWPKASNLLEHADFASHLPPQPGVDPDHYSTTRCPWRTFAELARRHGSVISSWLLDLGFHVLLLDPALEQFSPQVADSGEGRWTVRAAVDSGVPCPVLTCPVRALQLARSG